MHKGIAAAIITGSLLTGGAVGTALFGPTVATAQSSSSSDSSTSSDAPPVAPDGSGRPGPHGPRGPHGGRLDLSVAATAIGISEADLKTALESGQSMADVATAHNVDPQTVIDALVADAQAKLAEKVASGDITQAQADEMSANLVQRITDQVNHVGGPHGGDCPGMDGDAPAAPGSDSSSGSTSSGT